MSRYSQRNTYDDDAGSASTASSSTSSSSRRSYAGHNMVSSRSISTPVSSSSSADSVSGAFETGVIEKVMGRYGFISCHDRELRIFFHNTQLLPDENHTIDDFKTGLEVEFRVEHDPRTSKPVATAIRANPSGQRPALERISISERRYEGVVDCPAKQKQARRTRSLPQGNNRNAMEMGRLCYRDSGECFYVQFSLSNVADKRYPPQQDDKVSFYIGVEKLSSRQEAFNVTVIESASAGSDQVMLQGVVREMRDTFGFIERADTRTRIFFHYSELIGIDPKQGDPVEFCVREQQDGRQCACKVTKLSEGTPVMEEMDSNERMATVEVGLDSTRKGEEAQKGRLKFENKGREETLDFYDRDFDGNFTLLAGDRVFFQPNVGRNGQRKAINVSLCAVGNIAAREMGIVVMLKESSHFGFIRCCARDDLRVFFHFNEWMEGKTRPSSGDEVQFEFVESRDQRRAIRIKRVEPGTVEVVHDEFSHGVVQSAPKLNRMPSRSAINPQSPLDMREREMEPGVIRINDGSKDADAPLIKYFEKDCADTRSVPYPGDEVVFRICENKCSKRRTAVKVSVIRAAEIQPEMGFIVALKSNFGFIETADHREQLYFKFKNEEYKTLDEVSFVVSHRGGRTFAEDLSILPPGTISSEIIVHTGVEGTVIKASNDESVDNYAGVIEVAHSTLETLVGSQTEACSTEMQPYHDAVASCVSVAVDDGQPLTVPYTVLSLADIRSVPQKGDHVAFSIGLCKADQRSLHAVELSPKKTVLRGRVESLKEGFGFISVDDSGVVEKDSLFFHLSEVIDEEGEGPIEVGDLVEFTLSFNQKRGKAQGCNVLRISDQRPDRLTRKVEGLSLLGPRIIVRREPRKPDGTSGFNLPLSEHIDGVYVDLTAAEDDEGSPTGSPPPVSEET